MSSDDLDRILQACERLQRWADAAERGIELLESPEDIQFETQRDYNRVTAHLINASQQYAALARQYIEALEILRDWIDESHHGARCRYMARLTDRTRAFLDAARK